MCAKNTALNSDPRVNDAILLAENFVEGAKSFVPDAAFVAAKAAMKSADFASIHEAQASLSSDAARAAAAAAKTAAYSAYANEEVHDAARAANKRDAIAAAWEANISIGHIMREIST